MTDGADRGAGTSRREGVGQRLAPGTVAFDWALTALTGLITIGGYLLVKGSREGTLAVGDARLAPGGRPLRRRAARDPASALGGGGRARARRRISDPAWRPRIGPRCSARSSSWPGSCSRSSTSAARSTPTSSSVSCRPAPSCSPPPLRSSRAGRSWASARESSLPARRSARATGPPVSGSRVAGPLVSGSRVSDSPVSGSRWRPRGCWRSRRSSSSARIRGSPAPDWRSSPDPPFSTHTDLYAVPLDRPGSVRLTATPTDDEVHPAVHPDGNRIAVGRGALGALDIWMLAIDGTDIAQVTDTPDAVEDGMTWSPDGSRLAWWSDLAEEVAATDAAPVDRARAGRSSGCTGGATRRGRGDRLRHLDRGCGRDRPPAAGPDGDRRGRRVVVARRHAPVRVALRRRRPRRPHVRSRRLGSGPGHDRSGRGLELQLVARTATGWPSTRSGTATTRS